MAANRLGKSCHTRTLHRCFYPDAPWAENTRLSDLQERPVTKEVVTYVQERHPVAKQVCLPMAVKHPPTLVTIMTCRVAPKPVHAPTRHIQAYQENFYA